MKASASARVNRLAPRLCSCSLLVLELMQFEVLKHEGTWLLNFALQLSLLAFTFTELTHVSRVLRLVTRRPLPLTRRPLRVVRRGQQIKQLTQSPTCPFKLWFTVLLLMSLLFQLLWCSWGRMYVGIVLIDEKDHNNASHARKRTPLNNLSWALTQ